MILRSAATLLGALVALSFAASALADGEAGLVIDYGDGRTEDYCVAFEGDSIRGDELLALAGLDVNQFSGIVCSIDGTGCTHSGSFDSCTCECKSGSSDCTYWSYFVQPYGESWHYSVLGFQSATARDGDLQAWRWGEGSAASAPPPAPATFEAICGHPPGAPVGSPLPASTVPASGAPATAPPATAMTAAVPASEASTTPPAESATEPAAANEPSQPGPTASPPAAAAPSPAPPATGRQENGGGSSLLPFAASAGALLVAIAVALAWRRRRVS